VTARAIAPEATHVVYHVIYLGGALCHHRLKRNHCDGIVAVVLFCWNPVDNRVWKPGESCDCGYLAAATHFCHMDSLAVIHSATVASSLAPLWSILAIMFC